MRLIRVVNCVKLLNWETRLPPHTPVEAWVQRLESWYDAKGAPSSLVGLLKLRLRAHELLVVRTSGRVAIRLDYRTPFVDRTREAERTFSALVSAVRASPE